MLKQSRLCKCRFFFNEFKYCYTYLLCRPIKSEGDSASSTGQNRPESSSSAEQLDSPDREVLQLGSSLECASPAPTTIAYTSATATGWGMDYDPTQVAWDDEPATPVAAAINGCEESAENTTSAELVADDTTDHAHHEQHYYEHHEQTIDG